MKWRSSAWPIFHGSVILPYILKTIWYMSIIVWDNESVWHDVDLQISVGHCNLYFMVQSFCLISWRLFDVWTSLFGIMSQYDPKCDLKINIDHWPILLGPVIFLKIMWCMNIILWDYGSVWSDVWPQNKCRSIWPIFHGQVILSYISKTIWCLSVIFSDETVLPKLWPQSKYKSTWPIFDGLVHPIGYYNCNCSGW